MWLYYTTGDSNGLDQLFVGAQTSNLKIGSWNLVFSYSTWPALDTFKGISLNENVFQMEVHWNIDGLVQERSNSIANALELRLSCTNLSICS